ncbi:MAG: aminoacyl-histidine dipeptidase [Bacteroidales bacterium]|nr:aminoacyl-histidine dipeptidase [Bacteroidales bacterium]
MEINELSPSLIWHYFDRITKVPRPSKKEGKIRAFLINFAEEHNLQYKDDEVGNILIMKPATKGYENRKSILFQSHMDMVCEKNNDTVHDFDNDPIQTYIDGEWVKAKGTTLGGDNGIGIAAELAILASDNIEHGPIEALFTVDEETGLTGAFAMKEGFFSSKTLLNLDSEDDAEIYIGCAGGIDTTSTFTYIPQSAPSDYFYFKIDVKNLRGGHSGGDIHERRGNANKILTRFLFSCMNKYGIVLSSIDGGNLRNAIPREASAVVGVPFKEKESVRVDLNLFIADIENELSSIEPNITITLESVEKPEICIDSNTATNLILALYAAPHGVIAMSHDMENLVETSTNLASVKMKQDNQIVVATSQRSSVESEKYDIANTVEAVFKLAGASVSHGDGYPGWKPNLNSEIMKVAVKAYEDLYNITPAIKAIHAGLECGLFLKKYPGLDMISVGPTMRGVHSPDEQLHIPAVERFWYLLVEILKNA